MPNRPNPFRAPRTLFWVALAVRVLYMTLAHTYRIRLAQDHFQFGWEMGRIARALVTGFGYADPFTGHTGPTAWCPPLYPLLLAGVFKLCGVYTPLSAWVILTMNSVFSAATALTTYEIAARCYNRKVALWSGWLWALYPAAMQYAVRWVWEMSLTTMLFAWVLVLALRVRRIGDPPGAEPPPLIAYWAYFGLLWGMIALSNSTVLLFLPVCGVWMLWRFGAQLQTNLIGTALAAALCIGCMAPWMIRNALVFHTFIPLRDNFGAELYSSYLEGNNGFVWGPTIPLADHAPKYLAYKSMGEHAFSQQQGQLATTYIRSHPKHFLELAVKRLYFFWISVPHPTDAHPAVEGARVVQYVIGSLAGLLGLALSLRNRTPAAGLFAVAFLLLPLTYYFVIAEARFRHPLEPLLTIFAVYLFQSAQPRRAAV